MKEVKVGDWVKPKGGALPGPGMWIGQVKSVGTYGNKRHAIPGYIVVLPGSGKTALVDAEAMEYWFTPEEE